MEAGGAPLSVGYCLAASERGGKACWSCLQLPGHVDPGAAADRAAMPKYVHTIELVDGFANVGRGQGGCSEDHGYDWYGGI